MFVKICGTTTEEDALLAVALGADAVGFIFAPSPRKIPLVRARDIAQRLPVDVLTVGVFRNELPERVVRMVTQASLRAVQLHGHESAEETAWVAQRVPTMIKAFPAGDPRLRDLNEYQADIVLIDSARPGSGEMFDWSLAEDAPVAGHRLLMAGGLDEDNVADAIRQVHPWGVDVCSGVERRPGRKDPTRLRNFIEVARAAFRAETAETAVPDAQNMEHPYDWEVDR